MIIILCHLGTHAGTGVGLDGPRFHKPGQVSRPTLEMVGVPHLAAKGGRDSGGICLPAGPRTVAVLVLHVVGHDAGGGVRTAPGDAKVGGLAVGGSGYLGFGSDGVYCCFDFGASGSYVSSGVIGSHMEDVGVTIVTGKVGQVTAGSWSTGHDVHKMQSAKTLRGLCALPIFSNQITGVRKRVAYRPILYVKLQAIDCHKNFTGFG
ncbi:MAG: hypothetical protein GY833_06185 [Aestuariibacter sp.]|nr:hypothetical protein [Aestuariibacter sp.]